MFSTLALLGSVASVLTQRAAVFNGSRIRTRGEEHGQDLAKALALLGGRGVDSHSRRATAGSARPPGSPRSGSGRADLLWPRAHLPAARRRGEPVRRLAL